MKWGTVTQNRVWRKRYGRKEDLQREGAAQSSGAAVLLPPVERSQEMCRILWVPEVRLWLLTHCLAELSSPDRLWNRFGALFICLFSSELLTPLFVLLVAAARRGGMKKIHNFHSLGTSVGLMEAGTGRTMQICLSCLINSPFFVPGEKRKKKKPLCFVAGFSLIHFLSRVLPCGCLGIWVA